MSCRRAAARLATAVVGAAATLVPMTALATTPATPTPVEFTAPDGSWRVTFAAAPELREGSSNGGVTYRVEAGGDLAAVASYPESTFALPDTPPAVQAEIFAENYGGGRQPIVNTPTTFATFSGAIFVVDLAADSGPATLFGIAVRRDGRIHFVTYLDRQRDSAAAARAFVESYTMVLPAATGAATAAPDAGTAVDATASGANAAPTSPAVTVGGPAWNLAFPAGATPAATAGLRQGFGTQSWSATVDGDALRVDAAELPAGYEFNARAVATGSAMMLAPGVTVAADAASGGTLGVHPAADLTVDTEAGTLTLRVVQLPTQLVTVSYLDAGDDSQAAVTAHIDAFTAP